MTDDSLVTKPFKNATEIIKCCLKRFPFLILIFTLWFLVGFFLSKAFVD